MANEHWEWTGNDFLHAQCLVQSLFLYCQVEKEIIRPRNRTLETASTLMTMAGKPEDFFIMLRVIVALFPLKMDF